MSPNYWFTSDTHYWHSNVIRYCKRPQLQVGDLNEEGDWASPYTAKLRVEEMNEMLIKKHNEVVKPGDNVYHIGDFCFGKGVENILRRLNGNIHLVLGNHDDPKGLPKPGQSPGFAWIKSYYRLKIDNRKLILCHYPFARWDCAHHGAFHLHGHCHGSYKPTEGKILDVGVDCQEDYRPWNYDEICKYMEKRSIVNHHDRDEGDSI